MLGHQSDTQGPQTLHLLIPKKVLHSVQRSRSRNQRVIRYQQEYYKDYYAKHKDKYKDAYKRKQGSYPFALKRQERKEKLKVDIALRLAHWKVCSTVSFPYNWQDKIEKHMGVSQTTDWYNMHYQRLLLNPELKQIGRLIPQIELLQVNWFFSNSP